MSRGNTSACNSDKTKAYASSSSSRDLHAMRAAIEQNQDFHPWSIELISHPFYGKATFFTCSSLRYMEDGNANLVVRNMCRTKEWHCVLLCGIRHRCDDSLLSCCLSNILQGEIAQLIHKHVYSDLFKNNNSDITEGVYILPGLSRVMCNASYCMPFHYELDTVYPGTLPDMKYKVPSGMLAREPFVFDVVSYSQEIFIVFCLSDMYNFRHFYHWNLRSQSQTLTSFIRDSPFFGSAKCVSLKMDIVGITFKSLYKHVELTRYDSDTEKSLDGEDD